MVRTVPKAAELGADVQLLCQAQDVRARRLRELQQAACQIATIGEYYRTKYRRAWSTCLGGLLGALATAAIIAAFAWPAGTWQHRA